MHLLDEFYPATPAEVPRGLTLPSKTYRRQAWVATLGLFGFIAAYLGLTSCLAFIVYRLLGRAILQGRGIGGPLLMSLPALFFLLFLVGGLLAVKHAKDESLVEISETEQPLLFAFLRRVAHEAHAPTPHRIFLSPRVNAAVFYDVSFWSLIFPGRKNLELGLGLVNVLSLDQIKAVVAHEFGHFAQRSMAVGRWVYVAQQVAGHLVASRGIFDRVLDGLSRVDLRLAWIGWLMRLFVWALRAVLDTFFRLALLAYRALGKEMEFQADRVAVALSGSDSLVHALHRMGPADLAWEQATEFVAQEVHAGRPDCDLFELQSIALRELARVLGEPGFGQTPQRPEGAAAHRVFDVQLAHPPRMWLTHPPNREREDSAKESYVASALDERSAWALVREPEAVRKKVTVALFRDIKPVAAPPVEGSAEERFEKRYRRASLDPRYRGVYLGRSVAAHVPTPEALADPTQSADPQAVKSELERLYEPSLRDAVTKCRDAREEEALLEGLELGVLSAPGGVIRYRGRSIRRKDLPKALEACREELRAAEGVVLAHDLRCRSLHLAAARIAGQGWEAHLRGLHALLHCATHTWRDLYDAHGHLHHMISIALVDRRVSSAEREGILRAADDVYSVLTKAWENRDDLRMPADVEGHFVDGGSWTALSEKLGLNRPSATNLGDWIGVEVGWAMGAIADLKCLAESTLDALLEAEAKIREASISGTAIEPAPEAAVVPRSYRRCLVGQERPRQRQLDWWVRFQVADGLVPGAARAAVAACIVLPVLALAGYLGSVTVHVVNGLAAPVSVRIGAKRAEIPPRSSTRLEIDGGGSVEVKSATKGGEPIERFVADVSGGYLTFVYTVAQSAPLHQWTATYGSAKAEPGVNIGAPRWYEARQDAVLSDPPRSVSTKGGGARRTVLASGLGLAPQTQLRLTRSSDEAGALARAHVQFDDARSEWFLDWLQFAANHPGARSAVVGRARNEPDSVPAQRALLDTLKGDERAALCAQTSQRARARPDDGDLQYLAARCIDEPEKAGAALREAWRARPRNPWLAYSAGSLHAAAWRWQDALDAYQVALGAAELGSLRHDAAVNVERIVRTARLMGLQLKSPGLPAGMTSDEYDVLLTVANVERTARQEDAPAVRALRALAEGKLDEAVKLASIEERLKWRVLILAAASDGATPAMVARALSAPTEQVSAHSALILAALSIREGKPAEPWLARASMDASRQARLVEILMPEQLRSRPAQLEAYLPQVRLEAQGYLVTMGLIVLGGDAPPAWLSWAKGMLFVTERPFFMRP
jgi:Zn-dependent protease with chaperone function